MSNTRQIPVSYEFLPRVVPNIPNIQVSVGEKAEGYGRGGASRRSAGYTYNMFAHLWGGRNLSGGAKNLDDMTMKELKEYVKNTLKIRGIVSKAKNKGELLAEIRKRQSPITSDDKKAKREVVLSDTITTTPTLSPTQSEFKAIISSSEKVGHEDYSAPPSKFGVKVAEDTAELGLPNGEAEVAIAEMYNGNKLVPPEGLQLYDTNPAKTAKEFIEESLSEPPAVNEVVSSPAKKPRAKKGEPKAKKEAKPKVSLKAEKGHIYFIPEYDMAKWKSASLLGNDLMPIIVDEEDVFDPSTEYTQDNLYYLPPLDPGHPDIVALNAWINRNRNRLKPNTDRANLNPIDPITGQVVKAKTYSTGEKVEKLAQVPSSFGINRIDQNHYEGRTAEGTAWLKAITDTEEYKKAKPQTQYKLVNDAWKATMKSRGVKDPKLVVEASRYALPDWVKKDATGELVKEWSLVEEILDRIGRRINPLRYTSYQMNIDYFARRHIDGGNRGLSCIFAVGDYTPEEGSGLLVINGRPCDIKYQPLLFNGADNPHAVLQLSRNDIENDRHRCSFVMFESAGKKKDAVQAKNKSSSERSVPYTGKTDAEKEAEIAKWGDDVRKRVAEGRRQMREGWNPDLESEILPYVAKRRIFGEDRPYPPDPTMSDEGLSYTANLGDLPPLPPYNVEGMGKRFMTQDRYEQICRNMEKCGLLHLMGSGAPDAIMVPRDKVFSTKYEQDKIYVLPPFPKGDPMIKQLVDWMSENEIPINKSRANSGVGRSQTIGAVRQKFKTTYNDSAFTKAHPDLKKLLFDIGNKYDPLDFTSVQVNQNYEAKPHIDKNNIGLSMIFAVGDFKGGHLYINNTKYDIGHAPLIFNGAKNLHYVSKITSGDRFSFVYFRTGDKALREKVAKEEK
jgi:hypothetical protein